VPPSRVLSRRLSHFWWTYQWPILIVLWFAMMVLGYIGFWLYYRTYPFERPHTPGDLMYYTMQLVPMISGALPHPVPIALEISRHLLPVIEGYAGVVAIVIAVSGGAAVLRVVGMRDHVVICGLGRKGALLARRFRELGQSVVLVERDLDNARVAQCRDEGFIVLIGDATQPETLRHARVQVAAQVIGVCGDDGVNAGLIATVQKVVAGRRRAPILCAVHVVDPRLCELLREQELSPAFAGSLRLELFNVYALGAREMLAEHPPAGAPDAAAPHPLVVGLGQLGRNLIVQLALDWQPRFRKTGERLRVSVVGRDAERRSEALRQRYPRLAQICELVPYALDVRAADFQCAACIRDGDGRSDVTAAYVCLEDETLSLATSLTLAHDLRGSGVPIVVRVDERAGLVALARAKYRRDDEGGAPTTAMHAFPLLERTLYAFPLLERTCTPEIVLGGAHETLARAIHDEYVLHEIERGATAEDNPVLVPFDALPQRLQEANRSQADHIGVKLTAAGYDLEPLTDWDADRFTFSVAEVEQLSELEHQRWVADYEVAGWRHACGPKDADAKTHPDLVPWDELPDEAREKDREAVRAIPRFLAKAGLQVRRVSGTVEDEARGEVAGAERP
jgi:voltage-gated potassium channel Kch